MLNLTIRCSAGISQVCFELNILSTYSLLVKTFWNKEKGEKLLNVFFITLFFKKMILNSMLKFVIFI